MGWYPPHHRLTLFEVFITAQRATLPAVTMSGYRLQVVVTEHRYVVNIGIYGVIHIYGCTCDDSDSNFLDA